MTKTYTISRADLKAKQYKQAAVQRSGVEPRSRDTELLVRVLKKAIQK